MASVGINMPHEESGVGVRVKETSEWLSMLPEPSQEAYAAADDLWEARESVQRKKIFLEYRALGLAKHKKEEEIYKAGKAYIDFFDKERVRAQDLISQRRGALRVALGLAVLDPREATIFDDAAALPLSPNSTSLAGKEPATGASLSREVVVDGEDETLSPTTPLPAELKNVPEKKDVGGGAGVVATTAPPPTLLLDSPPVSPSPTSASRNLTSASGASGSLHKSKTSGTVAAKGSLHKPPVHLDEVSVGRIQVYAIEKHKRSTSKTVTRYRSEQYVDLTFPPVPNSIGKLSNKMSSAISAAWRPSVAFNPSVHLFVDGSDPDDVLASFPINDPWLLSAACMLASTGGTGDGRVDPLIDSVFITKREPKTGVYALRLRLAGRRVSVILDDIFPAMRDSVEFPRSMWSKVTPLCGGAATAHSKHFEELWVSLMEKSLAKVLGSYSALEGGFVEQALEIFTGSEAQRFALKVLADGPFRTRLWRDLGRWANECKYMVGAEACSVEEEGGGVGGCGGGGA